MTNTINIPKSFIANTHIEWTDTYEKYPASGFDVDYNIVSQTQTLTVAGVSSGDSFIFTPDTSSWTAGLYRWQILATDKNNNRKYVIAMGEVVIKVNFAGTTGHDGRCVQEILLDQINDWLKDNVTDQVQKVTHRDMEVWNNDRDGLFLFRKTLMKELFQIREARKRREGRQMKNVRFKFR